jgi:hypothetical protein
MERKKIELRDASAKIANAGTFQRSHNNAAANVNVGSTTNTNSSTPTPRGRERDPKAAAVAIPITHSTVRSPPPVAGQRKGG